MRFVFSVRAKDVQLGNAGPPGHWPGIQGWRALTRVLRRCGSGARAVSRTAAGDLATLLAPADCRLCGDALTTVGSAPVCVACMDRIEPLQDASGCRRCGDRFPYESARFAGGWAEGLCAGCRIELPAFERAVAFASYERETREMLHLLKFSGMEPVAQAVLAPGMAAAIRKLQAEAAASVVVVPVPLYRARLRRRGFNQSLLLARAAVEVLRRECRAWELTLAPGVLERIKDTHELYPLAPHQRRAGLRGAFRVADAEAVRGREVLLVDDILTTGATARECARVLRRAGAAKIWVATYARTLDEPAWQTARWTASNELAEGQRDASSASQQRNLNHF